jgi:hypothetical protein
VEEALDDAAEYSPSEKFRKIIFQINNALKIGIDVTDFLRETLEQIVDDQILQIKKYGKKLNSVTLFYLLIGVVKCFFDGFAEVDVVHDFTEVLVC